MGKCKIKKEVREKNKKDEKEWKEKEENSPPARPPTALNGGRAGQVPPCCDFTRKVTSQWPPENYRLFLSKNVAVHVT